MLMWVWVLAVGCAGLRSAQRDVMSRPEDDAAWVELGEAYRKRLKRKRAREAYSRALIINPENARALEMNARLSGGVRNPRVVRAALRNPSDDELWGDAGDYYMSIGRRDEALGAYTHALQLDPTDSEWQRAIFQLHGVDTVLEILRENPQALTDEVIGDVGDMLRESGQREAACEQYRLALTRDPTDEEWLRQVSECDGAVPGAGLGGLLSPEDYSSEGAILSGGSASTTEILRAQVYSDADLLGKLGLAHAQAGELDEAQQYLHSALLLKPSDGEHLELYVAVTGRTRREVLEQLAEEVPDNDEVLGELGDQMLAEGRPEEALVYYEQALDLDPDDPEWKQKRTLLRAILGK